MVKEDIKLDSTFLLIERMIDPTKQEKKSLPIKSSVCSYYEKSKFSVKALFCNYKKK